MLDLMMTHYPAFNDSSLKKEEIIKQFARENRNYNVQSLERLMSQLFTIVKTYIAFSYFVETSAAPAAESKKATPPGAQPVAKELEQLLRQKAWKEDPRLFLNFSRQNLAVLRFYNQRINLQPGYSKESPPASGGRRIHREENFFLNAYNRLKKYQFLDEELEENKVEPLSYSAYSNSQFIEMLLHNFLLEQEMFEYENLMNEKSGDINLLATSAALDHFYLSTRLELSLRIWMQGNVTNVFRDDEKAAGRHAAIEDKVAELLQVIRRDGNLDDPMLLIYEKAIDLLKSGKNDLDKTAGDLTELLELEKRKLPVERLKDFYSIVRSYLTRRYNATKNLRYLQNLHILHVTHQEMGYLSTRIGESDYMLQSELQNVINTALKLEKADWALQFLQSIPPECIMGPSQPDTIWSINLANIFFQLHDYQNSRSIIYRAFKGYKGFKQIEDQHYRLLVIRLFAKILYELDALDDDEGEKFCKTAKGWIGRDKDINADRRATHFRFFSITSLLFAAKRAAALKLPSFVEKNRKALEEMEKTPPPAEYEWLQKKMKELAR
ncbi:MAG: hypothetical protein IPJ82_22040 [Lewinellaceae bacterium]|nr:hypothetical protein [Lewinellaceae bacterium]